MNAVLYMRCAPKRNAEMSIDAQRQRCMCFAKENGLNVVGEYVDLASGITEKRAQYQRLIGDSDKGLIDAVIVVSINRISRNENSYLAFRALMEKNNVKVYSAFGDISDEMDAILRAVSTQMRRALQKVRPYKQRGAVNGCGSQT